MSQIALCMIVRNEAPTIAQTLTSAREALGPGPTVIVDTGSTDGTIAAIRACDEGAWIAERPFDDFASSRNHALGLAWEFAPLAFMISAGSIVRGTLERPAYDPAAPPAMTAETRLGSLSYITPRIFPPGWRYVGKVHEYAEGPGKLERSGLVVDYCLKDEARSKRWVRDLPLLEDDFSPRGRFYYAQTLECLGRNSQALLAYLARAEMAEGFWQERVISLIRSIRLARTDADAERYAQAALQLDGSRGEAYLALARRYEAAQQWHLVCFMATKAITAAPRKDALFVDVDREWRALMMIGDARASLGEFPLARDYWRMALEAGGARVPEDDRNEILTGLRIRA